MNEVQALAPPGWGFRPGAYLGADIDSLPGLPLVRMLQPRDRVPTVTRALIEHPAVLRNCTPADLFERYGETMGIPRQRWYEIHANALLGRVPKSLGGCGPRHKT